MRNPRMAAFLVLVLIVLSVISTTHGMQSIRDGNPRGWMAIAALVPITIIVNVWLGAELGRLLIHKRERKTLRQRAETNNVKEATNE